MRVKMLTERREKISKISTRIYKKGSEYDLPAATALALVEAGLAQPLDADPSAPLSAEEMRTLKRAAGQIALAEAAAQQEATAAQEGESDLDKAADDEADPLDIEGLSDADLLDLARDAGIATHVEAKSKGRQRRSQRPIDEIRADLRAALEAEPTE